MDSERKEIVERYLDKLNDIHDGEEMDIDTYAGYLLSIIDYILNDEDMLPQLPN
jgi:hypothetical protein